MVAEVKVDVANRQLYNDLCIRIENNGIINHLNTFDFNEKHKKLLAMHAYLDSDITALHKEIKSVKERKKRVVLLHNELLEYSRQLRIKREKPERLTDEKIVEMTALTFRLILHARHMLGKENISWDIHFNNRNCIRAHAKNLSHYDGYKILGGLALAVIGIGIILVAGCSIAASYGATSPFAISLAKFGFDAVAVGGMYVFSELLLAFARRKQAAGSTANVLRGIKNGVVGSLMTGVAFSGMLPASASMNSTAVSAVAGSGLSVTTTSQWGVLGLLGGTVATAFIGVSATLRGLSMFWYGLACNDRMRQSAENVVELTSHVVGLNNP